MPLTELDWTYLHNASDIHYKSSLALDSWWQGSQGETKRDVEKISGAGDENTRMELEPSDEVGSGQKTLVFFGCGLMCDTTQRGLSTALTHAYAHTHTCMHACTHARTHTHTHTHTTRAHVRAHTQINDTLETLHTAILNVCTGKQCLSWYFTPLMTTPNDFVYCASKHKFSRM